MIRQPKLRNLLTAGFIINSLFLVSLVPPVAAQQKAKKIVSAKSEDGKLSEQVLNQIKALNAEKESRTPAQQKIDSQLLYAAKMQRGEAIADGVDKLETGIKVDEKGLTLVDINAEVSGELLDKISELGGSVVNSFKQYSAIRAYLPLESIEVFAADSQVKFVRPADEMQLENPSPANLEVEKPIGTVVITDPYKTSGASEANPIQAGKARPAEFAKRAERIRTQLKKVLPNVVEKKSSKTKKAKVLAPQIGSVTSEGDNTHRAAEARTAFGVNGAGIKVGVLSDSFNFRGTAGTDVTNGDLPGPGNPNHYFTPVTVLQDSSTNDEGRAMLQIIHDLAPGALLYYATASGGVANFANNIRALRQAGCDVIIDDVSYPTVESPFQDAPIAQAVNDVTAAGAIYFSSAGNAGNVTDGTSGVWEGDFNDSGTTGGITGLTGGTLHDFDPTAAVATQDPIVGVTTARNATLFWSDPLGASTNDYDLYLINNNGTTVAASSTNIQNGTTDPVENLNVPAATTATNGRRIVIFKKTSAAVRYLHINLNRSRFGATTNANIPVFATTGQTKGHSSAAAAFSTAATPAVSPGPNPNSFNSSNVSETFTSDGLRRIFYNANGTLITPGCVIAACNGGTIRQKPDITAADGVVTTLPASSGLNPFYGTSAAAPHAGAIAALLKSANRNLTPAQIRTALVSTAIDIEANGTDRDTGAGIVMAYQSLQSINATPQAFLNNDSVTTTVAATGTDGDAFIEPGEGGRLNLQFTNTGGGAASNITATLTTTTPGVNITQGTSAYPNLASLATANNTTPFAFTLNSATACGLKINFALNVRYTGGNASPETVNFVVQTGQPGTVATTTTYAGAPVAIPDADINQNPGSVTVPFNVSGVSGTLANLKFKIGGTACNATAGSTTVGLDHTYVSDLDIKLISPSGTTVTLASAAGGAGVNFCNTVFDDAAANSIQTAAAAAAPFTGSFKPATPLSTFNGENPNGTWQLKLTDNGNQDSGSLRAFSMDVTPYVCDYNGPTAASVDVAGRVLNSGRGVARAVVSYTDKTGASRSAVTNAFGYFRFTNVEVGSTYIFQAKSKGLYFAPQLVNLTGELQELVLTAQ